MFEHLFKTHSLPPWIFFGSRGPGYWRAGRASACAGWGGNRRGQRRNACLQLARRLSESAASTQSEKSIARIDSPSPSSETLFYIPAEFGRRRESLRKLARSRKDLCAGPGREWRSFVFDAKSAAVGPSRCERPARTAPKRLAAGPQKRRSCLPLAFAINTRQHQQSTPVWASSPR
jgi:hypothetical protein